MVEQSSLTVAAVVVILAAALAGAAYVTGLADPLLGGDGPETTTPAPATPTAAGEGGDTPVPDGGDGAAGGGAENGGDATPTPKAYDFQFRIVNTTSCGTTCRDVTVRLTNDGTDTATGVTAESRILAGGDRVWRGTEDIGTVDAGESVTRTRRVNLGYLDAAKVQQNGGYVTIETTVSWDGGSRTFTERVKAA